ncbi:hypothetical protein M6B22_18205 [Jatrophihabitans cynanchi]|uniref:GYD domain-containing protein n=1 Tax=Jatrophihabitans cynanchi TaxID=2944128 RepID=A0ABY7JWT2_9ACTN|nr:hypothetical protein [Jatrophihabitans sp. SB3-54]WAX56450.1 hypothetical protein M6B22_18205 [Jatrophihabitans sp. SB3-54]
MRCMLKLELDTEAGNKAIETGMLPKIMQQVLDKTKAEAAYFSTESGRRTAFIFFDLVDASDIPVIAEPAFANLGARVTFTPVMNSDDLRKGLAQLG